jgi:tagatose-6-phosphate ketose/aldose isomerase
MANTRGSLPELVKEPIAEQEKAGYVYTASEIWNQPELWLRTAGIAIASIPALVPFLKGKKRILLTGAGSSYYVAASVATALRDSFPVVEAIPSTEIVENPESSFPRGEFVLVSFARSGDSPEGNAVIELAEELRPGTVFHLAVTCNSSGRLASLIAGLGSRGLVLRLPPETNDKSLAMTSSFTSMTVAGYALAFLDRPEVYRSTVSALSQIAGQLLEEGSRLVSSLTAGDFGRVFFLASRPSVAAAQEAQLKVQELTAGRIVAKAEDTLGFRHGFMSAVDGDSLIVLALSGDVRRRAYEMDLLREFRAKKLGKRIVAVSPRAADLGQLRDCSDDVLEYATAPLVTDEYRSPLIVLPGQLLGLYFSMAAGLKPDNPSPAGVINRVVKGVTIYPLAKGV